jgi:DNA-binding NarL/FixJ family response regulator
VNPSSTIKNRILLAQYDDILRKLLSALLSAQFEIVASVCSSYEALEAVPTLQPDVLVLDIAMPGLSGIEIAVRLQESSSATKIVLLTGLEHTRLMQAAMNSGVSGFVFKGAIFHDLPLAIAEALLGRTFVSSAHL